MNEQSPFNPNLHNDQHEKAANHQFSEEVRFIESEGREPDPFEKSEMSPERTITRIAKDLDMLTHLAASIVVLMEDKDLYGSSEKAAKVREMAREFKYEGKLGTAMFQLKNGLLEVSNHLRDQVAYETYIADILPKVKILEERLKQNSEYVMSGAESGEPL